VYTGTVLLNIFVALLCIFVLAVLGTMCVHLFVLRVPYVPTSRDVVKAMLALARLQTDQVIYDLGAGDGRVLSAAVQEKTGLRAIGVELVPTIWLLGWIRTRFAKAPIQFRLGDALKQNVSDANVIFVYMMPHFLQKLGEVFDRQLQKGTVVISHSFRFPNREPTEQMVVKKRFGVHTVYRYVW
jgi:precorrin-6B methylase 2